MRKLGQFGGGGISLIQALESRRLLSAGGLDTSFNGDGKVSAGFSGSGQANGVAVQSDGKIVEVGAKSSGNGFDVAMVRYNTNGTLDSSFGPNQNGKVDLHYGASGDDDSGDAVAIQADGKIVVAASTDDGGTFDILRFNSNGSLDQTFGSKGKVNVDMGFLHSGYPSAVAIQNDGKIVVFGTQESELNEHSDFVLVRLNTNGSLDNTFGNSTGGGLRTGMTTVDFQTYDFGYGLTIDYNDTAATNPDYGKIVVCGGGSPDQGATSKVILARFNTNGTLDTSFAGDGKRTDTLPGESFIDAEAVSIQGDGYVTIAGSYGGQSGSGSKGFLLMEYTPSGSLNTGFGTGGIVKTPIAADTPATSIINNGFSQQLIVGGSIDSGSGGFALAAYTLEGKLDPAFGKAGIEVTSFPEGKTGNGEKLALGPNHTIVAAAGPDFGTARFFDIGPNVSITATDPTAGPSTLKIIGHKGKLPISELVPNTATMIIAQDERLAFNTRVYFTVSGTALPPTAANVKFGKENYTLSGMSVAAGTKGKTLYYVDIPAGQTTVTVTLTPQNIPATTTTATFAIQSNVDYETSSPPSQTITILGTNPTQPTTTTLNDTADAYVRDGSSANTNFGTATQLVVKKSGTSGDNRLAYFKFDLSSISSVNSVTFSVFGGLNNTSNTNLETQLFSVADTSWTETGITYNNKPAAGATAIASATIADTTNHTHSFDVTTYVKAQFAAGHKIISFVLMNPSNSGSAFLINSKEASSNQPTLTVS